MSAISSLQFGWKSRRAWWFTATARTRERFVRTALGSFWLGLSNLLSIAVLAIVYGTVFKVNDFNHYVVYLGTGLVIWNTIAASALSAPGLFKTNTLNIKNSNINPIFYTLEEWAFQVQTFLQSFALVMIALSAFQPSLLPNLIISGIIPIVNFLIFIYWFPLLICLLGASYEDIFQLVPIVLQLMFLLSPILYQKESLGQMMWTADFNPIYRVISPLRASLLHGSIDLPQVLAISTMNIAGLIISLWLLNKERKFLPFIV
jgi:lipopolysaccharide transport system permease protein